MSYYDKWNDKNREAKRRGERDAFYRNDHSSQYDYWSERRSAYKDGYEEERRMIERREEDAQEEARAERMAAERRYEEERKWRKYEEEKYRAQEEQELAEGSE